MKYTDLEIKQKIDELWGGGGVPDYDTMPTYKLKKASKGKHKFFVPSDEPTPKGVDAIKEKFKQYQEGKSPHKKGSAKYKKHMAAKHASMNEVGRKPAVPYSKSVQKDLDDKIAKSKGPSPEQMKNATMSKLKRRPKDKLSPSEVNSIQAEIKLLQDHLEAGVNAPEKLQPIVRHIALHAMAGNNPYLMNFMMMENIQEGLLKNLGAAGMIIAALYGLGSLAPSSKDSPLGLELEKAMKQGDEVAAYHYKNLDLYTDASDTRTLVNLRIHYLDDSPRTDVKDYLTKKAKLPADSKTIQKNESVQEGALDGYYLYKRAEELWLKDNPGKSGKDFERVGVHIQDEYTEKAGGKKEKYLGKGAWQWTEGYAPGEQVVLPSNADYLYEVIESDVDSGTMSIRDLQTGKTISKPQPFKSFITVDEAKKKKKKKKSGPTPTDPSKWSYYKGQAKKKFDVYPSAYANAWAAKMYKKAGGGWRGK